MRYSAWRIAQNGKAFEATPFVDGHWIEVPTCLLEVVSKPHLRPNGCVAGLF